MDYHANKLADFDATEMFKNISKEKLEPIRELITEIEFLIQNRSDVHNEINSHIDKMQMEIDNFLLNLPKIKSVGEPTNLGGELVKAMAEFRKKKLELEELRLQEKLNFWRDVSALKRELREYAREFKEKETKSDLLDSLMV
jgi:hypothetical protein